MSTTTTNYGLHKPELTDAADITSMNSNWDKIDEQLGKLSNSSKTTMVEHTLSASGWNSKVYIWSNANIVSTTQIVELLPSQSITATQLEALQAANIVGTAQAVGRITLTAYGATPTIDIPVTFIVRGDS